MQATLIASALVLMLLNHGVTSLTTDDKNELEKLRYYRSLGSSEDEFEEMVKHMSVPSSNYRLNLTVVPLQYKLRMRVVLDDGFPGLEKFTAPSSVVIRVESVTKGSCSTIVLHQRNLDIHVDNVTITSLVDGRKLTIASQTFQPDRDFYVIELADHFVFGEKLDLFIPYTVRLSQADNLGIYVGHYNDTATNQTRYLSTTKLEPYHARKVYPLFDEPHLKAKFTVSIGRLDNVYHSLSNTQVYVTERDPELMGWVWDHYKETVLMSPYLLCMIVSDFAHETVQLPEKYTPVSTWAPKHDIDRAGGVYGAETGAKLLEFYEGKFKMEYALPKLDAVALPQFASGAMENWGLVTYRHSYLVWIPGEGTEAERRKITQVLAHEIVHQWYGNVVTCGWWSDIWLNEGFARYFQFWGMSHTIPEFLVGEAFVNDATQLAMVFDQGPLTHPVKNSAESPEESSSVFDRVSYEKGAALLNMVDGFLTREIFEVGIVDLYLQRMQWKSAFQEDLFDAFQEAVEMHDDGRELLPVGVTVHDVMHTWTLQSGFPVVRVSSLPGSNVLVLEQEPFVVNSSMKCQDNGARWWIPVKVVSGNSSGLNTKVTDLWMPDNQSVVEYAVEDWDTRKWVMVNPDAIGYYRVLYDERLTDLIREQLISDHSVISSSSRSQFMDDYFHLALAEYIPISTCLNLTRFLMFESSSNVWTAVLTHLKPMLERFTEDYEAWGAYQRYFLPHLSSALGIIGLRQGVREKGINVTLRAQLLDMACRLELQECGDYANSVMEIWKEENNQINPFPVDLRPQLYYAVIRSSETTENWEFMLEKYHEARTDTEKTSLLTALASSRNSELLQRLMHDNDLRPQLTQIMNLVAKNPEGRPQLYLFITEGLMAQSLSANEFASAVAALSGYWFKGSDLNMLEEFISSNADLVEPVTESLDTSIKNINENILWWSRTGSDVYSWLNGGL